MDPNGPHGGGRGAGLQGAGHEQSSTATVVEAKRGRRSRVLAVPRAQRFEAPDWMKAYGMPVAISCSIGYSLVGLVMVEPTAGVAFHPIAILTLLFFALGFVKGMQWWTIANESGKSLVCPQCGVRIRAEALTRAASVQTCRCGQDFSIPEANSLPM